ncbi:MAG: hypothetical protein ACOYL6_15320 [Bacteriovoracaceae bacterium]
MMKTILFILFFTSSAFGVEVDYFVPAPPELAPYASYKISNFSSVVKDGILSAEYDLPLELVGQNKITVALKGKFEANGISHLSGINAEAKCTHTNEEFSCSIQMKELDIKYENLVKTLTESLLPEEEKAGRLLVSQLFFAEPNGVLLYKGSFY